MNKNDIIALTDIKYREEDFGILLQSYYGGMFVVNENGIGLVGELRCLY